METFKNIRTYKCALINIYNNNSKKKKSISNYWNR